LPSNIIISQETIFVAAGQIGKRDTHMSKRQDIMAVIVLGLSVVSLPCLAGGTTVYTERSIEELKLMTTPELAGEARLVCGDIVDSLRYFFRLGRDGKVHREREQENDRSTRGQRYLERIGFVLRDRHHSQMPAWFEQLSRAAESRNQPDCNTAATAGGWRPKQ
jgi:hypothetical protein